MTQFLDGAASDLALGTAAEHLVCADLLLSGWRAFLADQNCPYDVAVDVGGRLVRVQVKATRVQRAIPQRVGHFPAYMWHVRRAGKGGRRVYAAADFDLLALVAIDIRRIASYQAARTAGGKALRRLQRRPSHIGVFEVKEFLDGRVTLWPGDCLEVIKNIPACSIDSVCTDPPYALVSIVKRFGKDQSHLHVNPKKDLSKVKAAQYKRLSGGFMGKQWDTGDVAFAVEFWDEVLRVLKPGGHVLAFGGTRTYHRLACAIEDAGFEIRDQIGWAYGSGFPKSHNLGGGWGTALKPAWEPIVMARKALAGTNRENMALHGVGGLNIDACRVDLAGEENPSIGRRAGAVSHLSDRPAAETEAEGRMVSRQSPEAFRAERPGEALGRWPANIIHDGSDEVIAAFPSEAGAFAPVRGTEPSNSIGTVYNQRDRTATHHHGDSGSAARFFYSSKADADDRIGSKHPTVKPVDLMQYLVRLVTPKGGVVLDPFAGTGTTGEAAFREGMRAILIERETEYQVDIARRMELAQSPTKRAAVAAGKGKLQGAEGTPLFDF